MRASVPDLEQAREDLVDGLGLQLVEDLQLHTPADEKMWGLDGVEATSLVLRAKNFLLELVEYQSPRPRLLPEGYLLSDQGYMNIALGYRDNADYNSSFDCAVRQGMKPVSGKPAEVGIFRVMYVNDRNGFSVEMLNARKALWSLTGFNSCEPYVEIESKINAPAEDVWQRLTDHAGMGKWSPFNCRVLREGTDDPNGVGCIRELSAPGLRITEEITAWDSGRHYAYQLRTGAPFTRHQGDVFLSDKDGVTKVRWAIRFHCWIPFTGKLTARLLRWIFKRALANLKSQLESRGAG